MELFEKMTSRVRSNSRPSRSFSKDFGFGNCFHRIRLDDKQKHLCFQEKTKRVDGQIR